MVGKAGAGGAVAAIPTGMAKPRKGGGLLVWLQGILCGLGIAAVPGAGVLAFGLLVPGLLVLLFDRSPGRALGRAVLIWNLAGAVGTVVAGWHDDVRDAMQRLSSPTGLFLAWGIAAAGWLVAQLVPVIVELALRSRDMAQARVLRAERREYEEEWSLDPARSGPGAD